MRLRVVMKWVREQLQPLEALSLKILPSDFEIVCDHFDDWKRFISLGFPAISEQMQVSVRRSCRTQNGLTQLRIDWIWPSLTVRSRRKWNSLPNQSASHLPARSQVRLGELYRS